MTLLAFGTPRKLPKAQALSGRVVVVDIAFAASVGGGFDQVTKKLIDGLGERLIAWVDHHDHERHGDYAADPRFVLAKKADHGACPEMITPALVDRLGRPDTILCHTDFDGLASAAKWMLGGEEPYPGADDDARAIDTRIGRPSEFADNVDRALRARPADEHLFRAVVTLLVSRRSDASARALIDSAAEELVPIERETERAALKFRFYSRRRGGTVAYVDVSESFGKLDKTSLLLKGQERANLAIVVDKQNVALAAPFDSGIDFLALLGLEGGMPTRVSLPRSRLDEVLDRLEVDFV